MDAKTGAAVLCRYDEELRAALDAAPLARDASEAGAWLGDVRLRYDSQEHYERLAAGFGMLQEWRDGVPRGAYNGTVRAPGPPCLLFLQKAPCAQSCCWR